MKHQRHWLIFALAILISSSGLKYLPMTTSAAIQQADLYMKDTPLDTGIEPNPDTGPMYVTEDIWVRVTPDPNYQPYPFPEASPPWIPAPHQNPEYRDPKYSLPNYVYVRVRNRGNAASSGAERLRLYWAKASTGLAWPAQWVDFLDNDCGPTELYGAEVTKPRKNAATATAAERNAYRDAVLALGTTPSLVFTGGISYWHKQDEVHQFGPTNRHASPAFLPWHREMMNRYEVLLQEANPTVKLLYWDWTTDPENSTGGFNFFTPGFMGASGRGTGGVSIGAPFNPPAGPTLAPPSVTRNLSVSAIPPAQSDATIVAGLYQTFAQILEGTPNHNSTHGYIGGGGNMSFVSAAAEDPFFFLLHTNVDRLWAQWQRDLSSLTRLDPATAYDGNSANVNITTSMAPWDGAGSGPGLIEPWTIGGGYIVSKTPKEPSVVSPPIYDTAPLVIPVLQPGEAVVIQIPWYPPNPADFACFSDKGHFCLLGRIETATTAPFGMAFSENMNVFSNTKNNNNIAWKNVTVVDNFPGPLSLSSVLVRNIFREAVPIGLRFANTQEIGASFFDYGRIIVDLKPELYKRWVDGDRIGAGIQPLDNGASGKIRILSPNAFIENIRLEPGETFSVDVQFELFREYAFPQGVLPKWDLIQTGAPGNRNMVVGGQRFEVDFRKLVLVRDGDQWRYLDDGSNPGSNWTSTDFNDSTWKQGKAELGFGDNPATVIDGGPPDRRHITSYFRKSFDVTDPSFFRGLLLRLKRDDGAVVYLNGVEIHRVNLPSGAVTPNTLAIREVSGLEEESFFPILRSDFLRRGRNVIAVEVHQNSPDSDDLSFNLELSANPASIIFPPAVAFSSTFNGALWQTNQTIPIRIEALDGRGRIMSVSLFADGKLIGVDEQPPYDFQWSGAALGTHRLRAVALNNSQLKASADLVIGVLENTPPTATLTQPNDGASFQLGQNISVIAQASDAGGQVSRVEFYLRDAELFIAPERLVGRATSEPFAISLQGLGRGHYMLTAVAIDNRGATSPSMPIHIGVH